MGRFGELLTTPFFKRQLPAVQFQFQFIGVKAGAEKNRHLTERFALHVQGLNATGHITGLSFLVHGSVQNWCGTFLNTAEKFFGVFFFGQGNNLIGD